MLKKVRYKIIALLVVSISIYFGIWFFSYHNMKSYMDLKYTEAVQKMEAGEYSEAISIFSELENYKDSASKVEYVNNLKAYAEADQLFKSGEYGLSAKKFSELGEFQDSKQRAESASEYFETDVKYRKAKQNFENGEFSSALEIFQGIKDYKDSSELFQECQVAIARLSNATTIAAGIRYSGCLTSDGSVLFSGNNDALKQELSSWSNLVSIAINGHVVIGLKDDGHVVTAGQVSGYYIDTSSWEDIVAVSAGQAYIVGLKSDGTIVAQGHTGDGQINEIETDDDGQPVIVKSIMDWTDIKAISTGWRHTVGLDSAGNVHIAGAGADYQLRQIENASNDPQRAWTDIIAISAGGGHKTQGHTVGLRKDGTVVAVGNNSNGQCNVYGDDWKNIVAIAAGDTHTVGLKSDKTIVIAGSKSMSETVTEWNNIYHLKFISIAAGMNTTLALTQDGTVYGTGYYKNNQLAFCNDGKPNPNSGLYESEWRNCLIHEVP